MLGTEYFSSFILVFPNLNNVFTWSNTAAMVSIQLSSWFPTANGCYFENQVLSLTQDAFVSVDTLYIFFGMGKCTSNVNSQATAHSNRVIATLPPLCVP